MRRIRKDDINWKDTAFLTKFMNETGKILNKYQSRLPTGVHRKVAKTIKKVRDMEIFAHVGLLKPTDKIPVGSFIEDLEEMHKKTIDPVTGRMFLKHSIQDTLKDKEQRIFTTLEQRLENSESNAEYSKEKDAELKERVLREMSLDEAGGRLLPDRVQRQWLIAQTHIIEREGKLEEKELEAKLTGTTFNRPDTEFLGAKEAYNEVLDKIKADQAGPNRLFDQFLSEKSLNVHGISGKKVAQGGAAEQLSQSSASARINEDDADEDVEIRRRISRIMADFTENEAVQGRKAAKHRYEEDEKYWKLDSNV